VVFDPPAQVTLPNSDALPPETLIDLFQFDHALFLFTNVGKGTVSEDGLTAVSDPGFGITRTGWGCGAVRTASQSSCNGKPPVCQKCKDGSFVPRTSQFKIKCEDVQPVFQSNGVNVEVDSSCRGKCENGKCVKDGNYNILSISLAVKEAFQRIFASNCIEDPLRQTIQDNLRFRGLFVSCGDVATNPDGEVKSNCAHTLGNNSFELYNLAFTDNGFIICGDIPSIVLHEIVHSMGNQMEPFVPEEEQERKPNGCQKSCFGALGGLLGNPSSCF